MPCIMLSRRKGWCLNIRLSLLALAMGMHLKVHLSVACEPVPLASTILQLIEHGLYTLVGATLNNHSCRVICPIYLSYVARNEW